MTAQQNDNQQTFYSADDYTALLNENETLRTQLEAALAVGKQMLDELEPLRAKYKKLDAYASQTFAISSPKIKPTEAKVALVLAAEAYQRHEDGSAFTPLNHIATNKALGERVGLSDKTAGDTCRKLAHVGIVRKETNHEARNRHGQTIEPRDMDSDRGNYFATVSTLEVKELAPDDLQHKLEAASGLKSANQIGAKDRAKAERVLTKMVKALVDVPCPYCGVKGELHIGCGACGWKDTDLAQPAPEPAKPKRERKPNGTVRQSWTDGRKSFLSVDYTPPCTSDLDQMPDKRMTLHNAIRGLKGIDTAPPPSINYRDFDEPDFGIEFRGGST